ncbi:MAG: hypothetical protein GXP16_13335 [Gammaproteobacteria bacterium]|nr:hypothetical protein [Gammaproteobacteria bacterium]
MSNDGLKLAPPRLKIITHQPWRKPLMLVLTVVIGVVCLLLGFALGQNKMLSQRVSSVLLSDDLGVAQERVKTLQDQLIDAQLNAGVHTQASNALRDDLMNMHAESSRLREEVTFYKSLMSPAALRQGLQVAELEIAPTGEPREHSFELLLTQVALRRKYIAGEVRIDLIGHSDDEEVGAEVVLSLTELLQGSKYPFKFRFRYFQDITGRITLPESFSPQRVLVTAMQNGKDPVQITFPWQASQR